MADEWTFAQSNPGEQLARLHFFSMQKQQGKRNIPFTITVREYVTAPQDQALRFLAEADPQTNQKTIPFTPRGWGSTLLKALSECIREIHRFPYEADEPGPPAGPAPGVRPGR
ncbi:MAG: hypothetical protein ACE5HD_08870 [Acidobacteriota bacterium]